MTVIFLRYRSAGWDERPTWAGLAEAGRASLVPLVVPVVIVLGFFFGVFTATDRRAGGGLRGDRRALYYRNVSLGDADPAHETALLTAAVIFLSRWRASISF
jgi:TRAP-type mannitol/chloroaromatic compound transport system permease large subunit